MKKTASPRANFTTRDGIVSITEDVLMIIIVIINLAFVIFDWSFGFAFFRNYIQSISYDFFIYYRDQIHPDFLLYDLFFVTIFIAELLIKWLIALKNKIYAKWWFYPFLHWYDVLGCIPLGTFIWLRLFRILAITIRLQEMGVIHLRRTHLYKQFYSAYQIFVQDVTDRALVKLIEALQKGIKKESNGSVIADAVKPDQSELAKVLSAKIHKAAESNYHQHRDDMKEQIKQVIKNGFENSKEMKKIGQLPLVGNRIIKKLEESLSDLSFQLADSLSSRLASDEVARIVEKSINTSLDSLMKENMGLTTMTHNELNMILKNIVDRALQKLKEDIDSDRKKKVNIPEPEEDILP